MVRWNHSEEEGFRHTREATGISEFGSKGGWLGTTTDGYSSYTSRASGAAGGLRSNNNAARSRNVSGFSTPTTPAEEKESYDTDCKSLLSLSPLDTVTH